MQGNTRKNGADDDGVGDSEYLGFKGLETRSWEYREKRQEDIKINVVYFIILSRTSISYEASRMAQWVKNLPAMQETQEVWVRSLGHEDPLEEEMATHSSILA